MKSKCIILYIALFTALIINVGCDNKSRTGFTFSHKIPVFTDSENRIIVKAFPEILKKLDHPGEFYVSKVGQRPNGYYIIVQHLSYLQNGTDNLSGRAYGTLDGAFGFKFDQNLKIIDSLSALE